MLSRSSSKTWRFRCRRHSDKFVLNNFFRKVITNVQIKLHNVTANEYITVRMFARLYCVNYTNRQCFIQNLSVCGFKTTKRVSVA